MSKKLKSKPIYGIFFLLATLVLVFAITKTAYRVYAAQKEYSQLVSEQTEKEEEKKTLEEEVSDLKDSDYITRYARDHYPFAKSGEEVVVLPKDDEE